MCKANNETKMRINDRQDESGRDVISNLSMAWWVGKRRQQR